MERWFNQTVSDLSRHEGFRAYPYPDPLSDLAKKYPPSVHKWGYRPVREIINELELDYNQAIKAGGPWTWGYGNTHGVDLDGSITEEVARQDLSRELSAHLGVLDTLVPEWNVYPDFAKTVLANLAYNMGNRLAQFKNTLRYFRERNWTQAAVNLEKSAWYRQVGSRATELVWRLKNQMIQAKFIV